jgi:hypothetical protein
MTVLFMKLLLNNVMLTTEVRKELPTNRISLPTAFAGNGLYCTPEISETGDDRPGIAGERMEVT